MNINAKALEVRPPVSFEPILPQHALEGGAQQDAVIISYQLDLMMLAILENPNIARKRQIARLFSDLTEDPFIRTVMYQKGGFVAQLIDFLENVGIDRGVRSDLIRAIANLSLDMPGQTLLWQQRGKLIPLLVEATQYAYLLTKKEALRILESLVQYAQISEMIAQHQDFISQLVAFLDNESISTEEIKNKALLILSRLAHNPTTWGVIVEQKELIPLLLDLIAKEEGIAELKKEAFILLGHLSRDFKSFEIIIQHKDLLSRAITLFENPHTKMDMKKNIVNFLTKLCFYEPGRKIVVQQGLRLISPLLDMFEMAAPDEEIKKYLTVLLEYFSLDASAYEFLRPYEQRIILQFMGVLMNPSMELKVKSHAVRALTQLSLKRDARMFIGQNQGFMSWLIRPGIERIILQGVSHLIANLTFEEGARQWIRQKEGFIPLLITALQDADTPAKVKLHFFRTLVYIALHEDPSQLLAWQENFIPLVVSLFENKATEAMLKGFAILVLAHLAAHESTQEIMSSYGISIPQLISFLETADEAIKENIALMIANLCINREKENYKMVCRNEGLIPLLITVFITTAQYDTKKTALSVFAMLVEDDQAKAIIMRQHQQAVIVPLLISLLASPSRLTKKYAIETLACLSRREWAVYKWMGQQEELISFLVDCLKNESNLKAAAVFILSNLTIDGDVPESIRTKKELIPLLVGLMADQDNSIKEHALYILSSLSYEEECEEPIIKEKELNSLLMAFLKHSKREVKTSALLLLRNLTYTIKAREFIFQQKELVPVLASFIKHPEGELDKVDAICALANLAREENACKLITGQEGLIPLLISSLKDTSIDVKRNTLATLEKIAIFESTREAIVCHHKELVPLAVSFLRETKFKKEVVVVLGNLAMDEEARSLMYQQRKVLIPQLVQLVGDTGNYSTQGYAIQALAYLSIYPEIERQVAQEASFFTRLSARDIEFLRFLQQGEDEKIKLCARKILSLAGQGDISVASSSNAAESTSSGGAAASASKTVGVKRKREEASAAEEIDTGRDLVDNASAKRGRRSVAAADASATAATAFSPRITRSSSARSAAGVVPR